MTRPTDSGMLIAGGWQGRGATIDPCRAQLPTEKIPMAPSTVGVYSCGGCDSRWNGVSRCHCSATGCHQTFSGERLFDRHRRDVKGVGTCLDPETIISPKTGKREMFLTDGVWRLVETPAPRGQNLRKSGESS